MQDAPHVQVRDETPADWPAIDQVNRAAFGGEDEVGIIGRLRAGRLVAASLVALRGDTIVGHVLLSWLPIAAGARRIRAVALAPMAVLPSYQRQGLGALLLRAAIAAARQRGVEAIVVLGHPDYYSRFGFSAERAARLDAPFKGSAFMALELVPGVLDEGGTVSYPAAFGIGR